MKQIVSDFVFGRDAKQVTEFLHKLRSHVSKLGQNSFQLCIGFYQQPIAQFPDVCPRGKKRELSIRKQTISSFTAGNVMLRTVIAHVYRPSHIDEQKVAVFIDLQKTSLKLAPMGKFMLTIDSACAAQRPAGPAPTIKVLIDTSTKKQN